MSMHKQSLTKLERTGLANHHLAIESPSKLSDCFRLGIAWALNKAKSITAQEIRACKSGLFTSKGNANEAIEYAQSMFPRADRGTITTALMVYHNTILEALAREVEKGDK